MLEECVESILCEHNHPNLEVAGNLCAVVFPGKMQVKL